MSTDAKDVGRLPPAPDVPLSLRERIAAIQVAHSGCETFRDAGGPVTTVRIAPKWMMPPIVAVTSPQGARDVLTATYPAVDRDFPFMTEQQKLNGGSLLNFSHREWVGRRRMLQPVFTTARIAELNGQMYDIAADAATSWRDGSEIDLDQESRRITMRVLGRTIMGFEPGSYTDELVDPLRRISKYIADRGRAPVKVPSWVPTRERRFAVRFNKVAHDLAAQILQDCRTDPELSAPLVRAMMEARDPETSEPLTDEEICHELVIFLASGLETTATTLAFALWSLGRHPDIYDRVAAEVSAVDEAALRTNPRSQLPYTVSVIQEALRLGGPTPGVMRIARQDMAVDGFRVEAGSMLLVGVYAMHRDPELWDRPLEFDPDRFSAGRSRMQWQFLPFGGGPRSCIGEFFALTAATLELASIVRHCRLTSRESTFPITAPLTIVPDGPIPALVQTVNS
ncbi:cytochrome P450 [Mycolicibacterium llatzerense]|uniref:Cytochrome P450 n=1 Tax=Mycolicibacterium llatzerense TaxID=280871 RepID=A0A0D1IZU2_9MYCO|nr:cytochrome P450 [Mycolicibacterium llatzerense]KIU14823.1 cytochrome P450 [Mycolicibacterium llatzerense]